MTVIKELFNTDEDDIKSYKSFSDRSVCIQKVGTDEIYTEAIDLEDSGFEYIETSFIIEDLPTDEEVE